MMTRPLAYTLLALLAAPLTAGAQTRPPVAEGNVPQGEVVIRPGDGGATLHEFRRNGVVYKVQVIPKKGRPYFLVDSDGNGSLDQVQWVLMSW